MTTHEIFERVKGVFRMECPKLTGVVDIGYESRLQADLGLDSADAIAIIAGLEDEFGLRLEEEDVALVETVGDVVEYMAARVSNGREATEVAH